MLLLCTSRLRKNKGHGPAPVTAQSTSSSKVHSATPDSQSQSQSKVAGSKVTISIWPFFAKSCQPTILSWSGMPSASIPKTWFLPAQNPPLPPHRPASSLPFSCELCAVTVDKHQTPYPPLYNHQASIRRAGDALCIPHTHTPTLNHPRADQRHCQTRLLDSGTSSPAHNNKE